MDTSGTSQGSKLFQQATKASNLKYLYGNPLDNWEKVKCLECNQFFLVKFSYQDGYKYIAETTRKCRHTGYEMVGEK